MMTFNRTKAGTKEKSFTKKDGTTVNQTIVVSDVILVGHVKSAKVGTTKSGGKSLSCVIKGDSYFDDVLETTVEEPNVYVNFYDTDFSDAATKFEKRVLAAADKHSLVAIKATKNESTDDEGNVTETYIGKGLSYWGSRPIEYRTNTDGKGCFVATGYAFINEKDNTVSVHQSVYSRNGEDEYYLTMPLKAEDKDLFEKTAEGKCPAVAFLINPTEYKPTKEGIKVTAVNAEYATAFRM